MAGSTPGHHTDWQGAAVEAHSPALLRHVHVLAMQELALLLAKLAAGGSC